MTDKTPKHLNDVDGVFSTPGGDTVEYGAKSLVSGMSHGEEIKGVSIDETVRHASILSGYSILTKSMIGSGLFVMAYGCSKFGIILGSIMLAVATLITWISLRTLSILAIDRIDEEPSFYSISEKLVPKYRWVIDVAVIVNCLGASTGYVITAGDFLSIGLYNMFQWQNASFAMSNTKKIIQAAMIVSLAPLCLMKEMSGTKIANLVGLTCLLYIVITTFVYCDLQEMSSDLLYMDNFLTAIGSFPTFIFAFSCQMNVFQIANELKNPTVKRMNIISLSSTLTGLMIYIPIMILPFLTFGSQIKPNFLTNLGPDKIAVQIAYVLAAISVSISYVLQVHPLRRSILSLYYGASCPSKSEEKRNRYIVVSIILMVTFGIAVGLDKIDVVTNFTGLLGGNTMCFLMPSILYLRRFGFQTDRFSILVMAVGVFSIILYPLCLTGIIYDMVKQ
jgi:amino acid permease